jgi:hypothetical protein
MRDGQVVRQATVSSAGYVYTVTDQDQDGGRTGLVFEVAQISTRFGAGPFARITFDG